MRLDVSVNLLTMHALSKGKITVFGGAQIRPNIHIDDIADLYIHLINHPEYVMEFLMRDLKIYLYWILQI